MAHRFNSLSFHCRAMGASAAALLWCSACVVPGAGVFLPGVIDLRESAIREAERAPVVSQGQAQSFGQIGNLALTGAFQDDAATNAMRSALAVPGARLTEVTVSTLRVSVGGRSGLGNADRMQV